MTLLITSLNSSTSGRTCTIILSDQSYFQLSFDWALANNFRAGFEVTPDILQKIKHHSSYFRLKEYALRQIAISPKTETKLRLKMRLYCQKHTINMPKTTEVIISEIKQLGLLDEKKYIEYYQRRFPNKSTLMLQQGLLACGISRTSLNLYLKVNNQQNRNNIIKLLAKKHVTRQTLGNVLEKNRILSMILRKGFSIGEAKSAIDDYLNSLYNKLS